MVRNSHCPQSSCCPHQIISTCAIDSVAQAGDVGSARHVAATGNLPFANLFCASPWLPLCLLLDTSFTPARVGAKRGNDEASAAPELDDRARVLLVLKEPEMT